MSTPGSGVTSEPVAMMMFFVAMMVAFPDPGVTSTVPGAVMVPRPFDPVDFVFLHQEIDAFNGIADNGILMRHHGLEIEFHA